MSASSVVFSEGKLAVITGASSGIGRAAAKHCAKLKMKVVMADIDEAELAKAEEEVKGLAAAPTDVLGVKCDVADAGSCANLAQKVASTFEGTPVSFLFANAGTAHGIGALGPLATWQKTMNVNFFGVVNTCQAFVPEMQKNTDPSIVVCTGSKQGITCPPGNLSYNCSKAAVKAYTEGLQHELRNAAECKVVAHLLVPGWVNTSIMLKSVRDKAQEAGEAFSMDKVFFAEEKPQAGAWMPHQVVEYMLSEMAKGVFYIICPDNDVDTETDNLRMKWSATDVPERRPPLSRWHPDYKEAFEKFVEEGKKK